jgi:hypothetical protein
MATRKQAVLLIHGIGNQQPMQTLRSFVKAVWTDHTSIHNEYAGSGMWSKPDTVSKSFELRKLTTPKNSADVRTDFYEFYWAHLMHGTGYGHIIGWAKSLLFRSPGKVSPGLKLAYYLLWAILVAVILIWLIYMGRADPAGEASASIASPFLWTVLSTVFSLVLLPLIGYVLKEIIGDAARYLRPTPQNIQRRHEIRAQGVELLNELHQRNYDRIIVAGHSLGSVVGYDILTYAFPGYNVPSEAARESDDARPILEKMAQDASENKPADPEAIQKAQRAYFNELEEIGGKWRVTDFITMGSPLAHADVLLATDKEELNHKKQMREFPECLPALEQKIRTVDPDNRRFTYGPHKSETNGKKVFIPHHAAVFAPTRWTNLYFPSHLIVYGDLIGGTVSRVFGSGIRDIPVGTKRFGGFLSHTHYWDQTSWKPSPGSKKMESVAALREALDLTDTRS